MHFLQHVLLQNRTNFICGISMQNQMLRFFKIAPSKLSLIILIQKSKTPNRVVLFCLYMNSIIMSSVKTRASKNWFHVRFYWFLCAQRLSVKSGLGGGHITNCDGECCLWIGEQKYKKNLQAGLMIMTPIPSLECRFFDDNYWF